MEPGPELDALVAEKVMEWERDGDWWEDGSHELGKPIIELDQVDFVLEAWSPSTSIADAWELIAFLDQFKLIQERVEPERWCVWFVVHENEAERYVDAVVGDTAPHAICLAALTAVGAM